MFRASLVVAWVLSGTIAHAAPAANVAAKPRLAQPVLALLELCSGRRKKVTFAKATVAVAGLNLHIKKSGPPTPDEIEVLNFLGNPRREGAVQAMRVILRKNSLSPHVYRLHTVSDNLSILTKGGFVVVHAVQGDRVARWIQGTAEALGGSDVPSVPPAVPAEPRSATAEKGEPPIAISLLPVPFARELMPFTLDSDGTVSEQAVANLKRVIAGGLPDPKARMVRDILIAPGNRSCQRDVTDEFGKNILALLLRVAKQVATSPQWRIRNRSRSPQPAASAAGY